MSEGSASEAVVRVLCAAPGEASLAEVAARVGRAVAQAEPAGERARRAEAFAGAIASGRFLPSVPILQNAGRSGQLAACFVVEPEDTLASIYDTLGLAARIQQGGGGVGIHFSRLRARGAPIRRSGGVSPGPLAFVELFAHSARVNERAGRRPGAHLAVLSASHPDALALARAARTQHDALRGMGLALALDAAAVEALRAGTGELWRAVAESIVETGQPSLLFLDRIEAANPVPELGPLRATNPCGEQPLLPGESCVLASLDLTRFADARGALDWPELGRAAELGVRFLDDVVETATLPAPALERATLRTRKIGLGFLGLADLALRRELDFDSPALEALADEVTRFLRERGLAASVRLADERGAFPAFTGRGPRRRNATVLAVAPTGTLRLIAGANGGIEPLLDPVRTIGLAGGATRFVDASVRAWLEGRARDVDAVLRALAENAPAGELPGLAPREQSLLRRAGEIDAGAQIRVQAAVQRHVDGAVSKTVHLAAGTAPDAIRALALAAHDAGCKGVALYAGPSACAPCALPERGGEWL